MGPGDPGRWHVRPLGAEPWVPGVTGTKCTGREGIWTPGNNPRAGPARPPAGRPRSGPKLGIRAAVSARPTGSPFQRRRPPAVAKEDPRPAGTCSVASFSDAVLPLLPRLTCSSCPRSGSPPSLVLCRSLWLPPAGQPSPRRAGLSPSALPALPCAQASPARSPSPL